MLYIEFLVRSSPTMACRRSPIRDLDARRRMCRARLDHRASAHVSLGRIAVRARTIASGAKVRGSRQAPRCSRSFGGKPGCTVQPNDPRPAVEKSSRDPVLMSHLKASGPAVGRAKAAKWPSARRMKLLISPMPAQGRVVDAHALKYTRSLGGRQRQRHKGIARPDTIAEFQECRRMRPHWRPS